MLLEQPIGCSEHISVSRAWSMIFTADPAVKLTNTFVPSLVIPYK